MTSNTKRIVGAAVVLGVVILVVSLFFWGGLFRFDPEEETFWVLIHQKGHWYLEILISGVETLIFDLFIGVVAWQLLLKPYIRDRQARLVAEEHELHGIEDHDHELHESVAHAAKKAAKT